MYQEHTALQAAGQILLAFAFLASGVRNAFWTFAQHEQRMAALVVGAWLLVAFTLLASLIFHRWWLIQDPLLRHLHLGNLLVNAGVAGGLLLVASI